MVTFNSKHLPMNLKMTQLDAYTSTEKESWFKPIKSMHKLLWITELFWWQCSVTTDPRNKDMSLSVVWCNLSTLIIADAFIIRALRLVLEGLRLGKSLSPLKSRIKTHFHRHALMWAPFKDFFDLPSIGACFLLLATLYFALIALSVDLFYSPL